MISVILNKEASMLSEKEQCEKIDKFTEDLTMHLMSEALVLGISNDDQEQSRAAIKSIGEAAKSVINKCTPRVFAASLLTFAESMMYSAQVQEVGRQVTEHIDESIATKSGMDEEGDD